MQQSPMLAVPLKKTEEVRWEEPIRQHIRAVYHDDPARYADEIRALQRLRQDARGAGKDDTGRDLLYRYYGQLDLLELRFPINENNVSVEFTWLDAFNGKRVTQHSAAFEKASVLFNIAALLSSVAEVQDRTTPEGLKKACQYYQVAAGVFQFINSNFLHAPSADLNQNTISVLTTLMLAQAQECFLERAVLDDRRPKLVAMLAMQASAFYSTALEAINAVTPAQGGSKQPPFSLKDYFDKSWAFVVNVKSLQMASTAHYYMSLMCEADAKYGIAVGHAELAEKLSKEAVRICEKQSSVVPKSLGEVNQVRLKLSTARHEKIDKENNVIYNEAVPKHETLNVDKETLAKQLWLTDLMNAQEVIGHDLFQKLIPLSVHEASSFYTEEKAKIWRTHTDMTVQADDRLAKTMKSLKLASTLNEIRSRNPNPDEGIFGIAAATKADDENNPLDSLFEMLTSMRERCYETLQSVQDVIEIDRSEYSQLVLKFGSEVTQSNTSVAMAAFIQDHKTHSASWKRASESDSSLMSVRSQHHDVLKNIFGTQSELRALFPSTSSPLDSPYDGSLVMAAERHVSDLDKWKKQRGQLLTQLKDQLRDDDITHLLILNKNNENGVFQEELQKHAMLCEQIKNNCRSSDATLKDLEKIMATLSKARAQDNTMNQKETVTRQIQSACQAYRDIKQGVQKGIQFYSDLSDLVDDLHSKIKACLETRREERSNFLQQRSEVSAQRDAEDLRELLNKYNRESASSNAYPTTTAPTTMAPPPSSSPGPQAYGAPSAPPGPPSSSAFVPYAPLPPQAETSGRNFSNGQSSYGYQEYRDSFPPQQQQQQQLPPQQQQPQQTNNNILAKPSPVVADYAASAPPSFEMSSLNGALPMYGTSQQPPVYTSSSSAPLPQPNAAALAPQPQQSYQQQHYYSPPSSSSSAAAGQQSYATSSPAAQAQPQPQPQQTLYSQPQSHPYWAHPTQPNSQQQQPSDPYVSPQNGAYSQQQYPQQQSSASYDGQPMQQVPSQQMYTSQAEYSQGYAATRAPNGQQSYTQQQEYLPVTSPQQQQQQDYYSQQQQQDYYSQQQHQQHQQQQQQQYYASYSEPVQAVQQPQQPQQEYQQQPQQQEYQQQYGISEQYYSQQPSQHDHQQPQTQSYYYDSDYYGGSPTSAPSEYQQSPPQQQQQQQQQYWQSQSLPQQQQQQQYPQYVHPQVSTVSTIPAAAIQYPPGYRDGELLIPEKSAESLHRDLLD